MQFAVYPMPRGGAGFIVDVQSRLLEGLAIRVVVPLVPRAFAPRIPMKTLNPMLLFNGAAFMLMTQHGQHSGLSDGPFGGNVRGGTRPNYPGDRCVAERDLRQVAHVRMRGSWRLG